MYTNTLTKLMYGVLDENNLQDEVELAGQAIFGPKAPSVGEMVSRSQGRTPMVACYIDSSFPALLWFLHKYGATNDKGEYDISAATLANANAGGENVARGSILGAVLGAANASSKNKGNQNLPDWCLQGLHHKKEIEQEIKDFTAKIEKINKYSGNQTADL